MDIRLPMYARLSLNVSSYFPEQGKEDYQHISSFLCVKKPMLKSCETLFFFSFNPKGSEYDKSSKEAVRTFPPFVGLVYCKFPNIPY